MRLTKKAFAAWLAAQEPEAVVGRAGRTGSCPLAEFARYLGAPQPKVNSDHWIPGNSGRYRPLPGWARDFVAELDEEYGDGEQAVTARDALAGLGGAGR